MKKKKRKKNLLLTLGEKREGGGERRAIPSLFPDGQKGGGGKRGGRTVTFISSTGKGGGGGEKILALFSRDLGDHEKKERGRGIMRVLPDTEKSTHCRLLEREKRGKKSRKSVIIMHPGGEGRNLHFPQKFAL